MVLPFGGQAAVLPTLLGQKVTPAYMRTATAVWNIAVRALEGAHYQHLLPDLLPDVLRGEVRDERSEAEQVARTLCGWARRGAALPLRYHLTRSRPPSPDGSPRAVVGAFSALRGAQDCARQFAADTDAVRDLLETLGIAFAGGQPQSGQESVAITGLFAEVGEMSVQIATLTDHGEQSGLLGDRGGHPPTWLTALRIDLTGLTGWLMQRTPGLEARG
jgi:hypothetical protein